MIDIVSLSGSIFSLIFGIIAIFTDFKDQKGKITRVAIYVVLGIGISGILSFNISSIKDKIAIYEKEQDILNIFKQIYKENSRLNPNDIKLQMKYVCMTDGQQYKIFEKQGWNLGLIIKKSDRLGKIRASTSRIIYERNKYHSGGEHFEKNYSETIEFSDFFLGEINNFLYPQNWNNSLINIDFNGTDRTIFDTPFIIKFSSIKDSEIELENNYYCNGNNEIDNFMKNTFSDRNNDFSENEYITLFPVKFHVSLMIRGIIIASTSGYIYQIQSDNPFKIGKEITKSVFPPLQINQKVFPEFDLSKNVKKISTWDYIPPIIAIVLCFILTIIALRKLIKNYKF